MTSTAGAPAQRPKLKRALLALAIGCALSLVAGELVLRILLFGESSLAHDLGHRLRSPEYFSDGNSEDDYWKLQYWFTDPARLKPASSPDAILGWTGPNVTPGTYEHADEGRIAGRIPVLFYGDSFAECLTPPDECFQGLLQRSDLASRYCLLNYGVSGYGLDQIYLMLARSIDRFAGQRPIVIVSLLVDSDLDRSLLAFRCWPKPRLEIVGDELLVHEPPTLDPERFLALHPSSIQSYLWRLLAYERSPLPRGVRDVLRGDHRRIAQKKALNQRILTEIQRLIQSRGLTCTLFLFHSDGSLAQSADWAEWQEPFVRSVADELGMPVASARPFLVTAARELATDTSRFYGRQGALVGHHNAAGNAVVFEALRRIIEGRLDPSDTTRLAGWVRSGGLPPLESGPRALRVMNRIARVSAPDGGVHARHEIAADPASAGSERVDCLFVRGGALAPTEVHVALEPGLRRWRASISALARTDLGCTAQTLELEVRADDMLLGRAQVSADSAPVLLEFDIAGKRELSIVAHARGAEPDCAWIRIAEPRLE